MQGFQYYIQQVQQTPWAAGSQATTINCSDLEQMVGSQHLHLVAWIFQIEATTITLSGGNTLNPDEFNNAIDTINFSDGEVLRFTGTNNDLRSFEWYETGGWHPPEPITIASGGTGVLTRMLHMGPPDMYGSPTDYAIPVEMLTNGTLSVRWNQLATMEANLTAFAGVHTVAAVMVGLDELRVPPVVERKVLPFSSLQAIQGQALVPFAFLGNSSSWDAIAAGDFGNITVKDGRKNIVNAVDAEMITQAYNATMLRGGNVGGIFGEPRNAGDVAFREVNPGTATALQAMSSRIQPLLWCSPGGRLSKVLCRPEKSWTASFSGTNTGSVVGMTRILPRSGTNISENAKEVADGAGTKDAQLVVKSIDGSKINPGMTAFMPYAVKRGQ